jgi:hypothetical protein
VIAGNAPTVGATSVAKLLLPEQINSFAAEAAPAKKAAEPCSPATRHLWERLQSRSFCCRNRSTASRLKPLPQKDSRTVLAGNASPVGATSVAKLLLQKQINGFAAEAAPTKKAAEP